MRTRRVAYWAVPICLLALATAGCTGGGAPTVEPAPPAADEQGEAQPAPQQPAAVQPRAVTPREAPATPSPKPEPTPPEPAYRTIAVSVPASSSLEIELVDAVSSETSQVGDSIQARLRQDIVQDDVVVIPAGSTITGSVTEAVPTKKIGGQALVAIHFDRVDLPSGESYEFAATVRELGKKQTGKDAATIGGATAGGAVLGRILKRKDEAKGTLIGAAVGAAVGTAIAAKNEGDPVTIEAGAVVVLVLDAPLEFEMRVPA